MLANRRKLNICFLCKTFQQGYGGAEAYYFRMANALAKLGHQIHIVCQEGRNKDYVKNLHPSILIHEIKHKNYSFRGSWRIDKIIPLTELGYALDVFKMVGVIQRHHQIDLIQYPDWTHTGFFISLYKRTPTILRLHGMPQYFSIKEKSISNQILMHIDKSIILRSTKVVSVSSNYAQFVKDITQLNVPIKILYNGIDQTIYKPNSNTKKEDFVLFVGRLEEGKGINVILKAIPLVLQYLPKLIFVFAGKTGFSQEMKTSWDEVLKKEIPHQNLLFLGAIPPEILIGYYHRSLVCIYPSLYEPGGTAAMEAMACGCPVIATNVGGFMEIIEHNINGVLISSNDYQALANSIIRLISDEEFRNKLSINGVNNVSNKFNLQQIVEKTINMYEEIIA